MRRLGIFALVAVTALPLQTFAEESRAARQQARQLAAVNRMVARSRPQPIQPRGPSAMPAMQRQIRQPQPRAFRPEGMARSGRMMDPDIAQPIRARSGDGPRWQRGPDTSPRAINTAAIDRPVQAPQVSNPRMGGRRDADRADRMRQWNNRNRDRGNRGGNIAVAPGANVENHPGAVTAPNTDQQEGHRHWGNDDHHHDGKRRNWRDRHRNWHERHEGDPDFDRKHRRWHNREWYRRNYNRFVLFGGGYYYWNRGYWYPAYGYSPYYSTYTYNAPIYSYNGLPPGQVLAKVQSELQQRGYYNAAVDGTYGPITRQALLNYQGDHGLPMTGEVDQETLYSLGFQ